MGDKRLNDLLRWSIENMDTTTTAAGPAPAPAPAAADADAAAAAATPPAPASNLTPEILSALMGGPSDADLMKASLEIAGDAAGADVSLDDKLIALDNFEQLIENLDNANNIQNLGLWMPLLDLLADPHPDVRRMAAWCIGTAVQNNERTQERLHALGGLPRLVELALSPDEPQEVRRKAIYALSSAVRNYQPAMDVVAEQLASRGRALQERVDAADMDKVDVVINSLREEARAAAASAAAAAAAAASAAAAA